MFLNESIQIHAKVRNNDALFLFVWWLVITENLFITICKLGKWRNILKGGFMIYELDN